MKFKLARWAYNRLNCALSHEYWEWNCKLTELNCLDGGGGDGDCENVYSLYVIYLPWQLSVPNVLQLDRVNKDETLSNYN